MMLNLIDIRHLTLTEFKHSCVCIANNTERALQLCSQYFKFIYKRTHAKSVGKN